MSRERALVWDPFVRVVHWTLAALIAVELLNEAGANPWHRYLGYVAAFLVVARLAWGFSSSRYARLAVMASRASEVLPYLRALKPSVVYAGHNPLGALMAFALWALTLLAATTGWMLGLDSFWGDETLQQFHAALAYALAAFAVVHVCGVLATSRVQQENLIKAMVTGSKSLPVNREQALH